MKDRKNEDKNSNNNFVSDNNLTIVICLDVAFGLIWDNLALGLGLGVVLGLLPWGRKKK